MVPGRARELVKSQWRTLGRQKRQGASGLFVSSYGGFRPLFAPCAEDYVPAGAELRPLRGRRGHRFPASWRSSATASLSRCAAASPRLPNQSRRTALDCRLRRGRPMDRTRLLGCGRDPAGGQRYFVECYRRFVDLKCVLEAREHTAQVASEDREEREDTFSDR